MADLFDGDTYHDLSKPYESVEAANNALSAFQEELSALRKKHRIADLLFVIQVPVMFEGGECGLPGIVGYYGDVDKSEGLAAYAYGQMAAERQGRISKLAAATPSIKGGKRKR